MLKKILIAIILCTAAYFLTWYLIDIYAAYMMPKAMSLPPPPPPAGIGIEAGPVKVVVDDKTPWMSIIKAVTTVLSTYLGIKLINKYIT